MRGTYLPKQRTPLSFLEASGVLSEAFRQVIEAYPSRETLSILLAHTALETGRWKAIWNNNWGNVKARSSWPGYYTAFRCNEVISGRVRWFDPTTDGWAVPPGHPQTRFRAFLGAAEGAEEYIRFLAIDTDGDGRNRYQEAWDAALWGDTESFVRKLHEKNYFTARLERYLKGVTLLSNEYDQKLKDREAPAEHKAEIAECIKECARIEMHHIPWVGLTDDNWEELEEARSELVEEKF